MFYCGAENPAQAHRLSHAFLSINRLRTRVSDFAVNEWMMDNGAWHWIRTTGDHWLPVSDYLAQVARWSRCGNLHGAFAQDYLCGLGRPVADCHALTVDRFELTMAERSSIGLKTPVLPVLHGVTPADYVEHIRAYGSLLPEGGRVGVGSLVPHSRFPGRILAALEAIRSERPDLLLHGFGLKLTALRDVRVRRLLHSADSMAWAYAARRQGRSPHDYSEAVAFAERVNSFVDPGQLELF